MKKMAVIFALLVITNLPISCIEDDCGSFQPMDVKITDLFSSVGTYSSNGFSAETMNDFKVAAIAITIESISYSEIAEFQQRVNFSFLNTGFTCSPVEPKLTHTIESIIITSDSSVFYNELEYVAGENLADLFKITRYSYVNEEITINEFIDSHKEDSRIFGYTGDTIVFQLIDKPEQGINQTFSFQFHFSDLKIINSETSVFEVNN